MNPDELADLEEQRSFLIRSLDDLDRELAAGDIDDLDAATLRTSYRHRLDEVQQAIETGEAIFAEARPRRTGRTIVVAVVVAALALGAGLGVAFAAGTRKPGESATGNIREFANDKLTQAAALQDEGKPLEALKLYDSVIKSDPKNAEALAERGFLLLKLGSIDTKFIAQGQLYVERALLLEPTNPQWLVYRAMGLQLSGDKAGANKAIDEALANDPPAGLKAAIEAIRKSLAK